MAPSGPLPTLEAPGIGSPTTSGSWEKPSGRHFCRAKERKSKQASGKLRPSLQEGPEAESAPHVLMVTQRNSLEIIPMSNF